jgi:soluble lytic murein transglycosylase
MKSLFAKSVLTIFAFNPLSLTTESQSTPKSEAQTCGIHLKHVLKNKTFSQGISSKKCPLSSQLATWVTLQGPQSSFEEAAAFITAHPDWPLLNMIQKRAEDSLESSTSSRVILSFFKKHPPLTGVGVLAYAQALESHQEGHQVAELIKQAWHKMDLAKSEVEKIRSRYKKYLSPQDYQARARHLLNQEKIDQTKVLMSSVDKEWQALIQARIAFIKNTPDAPSKLAQVPKSLLSDKGLIFDQIKWHRKQNNNHVAAELLLSNTPTDSEKENWWKEQNILVRRFIEEKNYAAAYKLAKSHRLMSGESFANAEWLAGWLSLRFLNNLDSAEKHFRKLFKSVKSPISTSRAAYWLACTFEKKGDKKKANFFFKKAQQHPATYYGQLAFKKQNKKVSHLRLEKFPRASEEIKSQFYQRPLVQVVELLSALGDTSQVEPFLYKLAQDITDPQEQGLLIQLAAKVHGAFIVEVTKKSTKTEAPLLDVAYPKLPKNLHKHISSHHLPLVHAIIRQESRFRPTAQSPAGAMGLMQLMPATAQKTAKKIGLKIQSLFNPETNVRVGHAHIQELESKFNGSMILTIAAYNAGAKAVEEWIEQNGDPRRPGVDLVDWVELIPYAETRNYVQRVIENHEIYCLN